MALSAETGNRYFRHAIAVLAGSGKVGYVAPEIAGHYYDAIKSVHVADYLCRSPRICISDHETSGVELLLDMTGIHRPIPSEMLTRTLVLLWSTGLLCALAVDRHRR